MPIWNPKWKRALEDTVVAILVPGLLECLSVNQTMHDAGLCPDCRCTSPCGVLDLTDAQQRVADVQQRAADSGIQLAVRERLVR